MSDRQRCMEHLGTTMSTRNHFCGLARDHDGDCVASPRPLLPNDIQEAVDTLLRFHIGDMVYDIRERVDLDELEDGQSSWDHPDVIAWSKAVTTLERYSPVRHSMKLAE